MGIDTTGDLSACRAGEENTQRTDFDRFSKPVRRKIVFYSFNEAFR